MSSTRCNDSVKETLYCGDSCAEEFQFELYINIAG